MSAHDRRVSKKKKAKEANQASVGGISIDLRGSLP
jgi:hypothetical protein